MNRLRGRDPAVPREADGETTALRLLQAGSGTRRLAMHALIVLVLLITAQTYDGSFHALSHWTVLGAYAAASIGLGIAERRGEDTAEEDDRRLRRMEWLAWASTGLNAAVVVYVEVEHILVGGLGFDDGATASRLPAFLLLLQTALNMRVWHTVVYAGVVSLAWGGTIGLAALRNGSFLGPDVTFADEVAGLLFFVVASLVVLDGVRRLKGAVAAALTLERQRTQLARFVPDGVALRLAQGGGVGAVRECHACLLALDTRGFSKMTRERPKDEVVDTLLGMRALVHRTVSEHRGIIDKYVGDGILAQFVVGTVAAQTRDALACAHAIHARLVAMNRERAGRGLAALRITVALHAGDVLVGVFDDGFRAEYTVLGPAMNMLGRLEIAAKAADLSLAASEDFVQQLGPDGMRGLSLTRLRPDQPGQPALFAVERTQDSGSAGLRA